jgi:hypothetical protein
VWNSLKQTSLTITGGESISNVINIHNLFHILHPFWIHHTKNLILLSKQFAHLQMTLKNCTKSSRRSEHQLFHTLHPYRFTTIQKNNLILSIWLYEHLQMTQNYSTKFQVSPIDHLGKETCTSYFTTSSSLASTITRNIGSSRPDNMHISKWKWHCTTFQVSTPLSEYKLFNICHPLRSTTTRIKMIGPSCPHNIRIY